MDVSRETPDVMTELLLYDLTNILVYVYVCMCMCVDIYIYIYM